MPRTIDKCPACGSREYKITGPAAPPIHTSVGEASFEQPEYFIDECAQCGLLYRDRTLSSAEFQRYYSFVPAAKWEIEGYYPTETAVLSLLSELPAGSRILDFGCSSGRLLAGLTLRHQCYGIEINPEAARAAGEKGLHMLSWDGLKGRGESFDAVVLADVFEHLSEPLDVLRSLAYTLAPEGSLIIVTGDGDAAACRRDPAQFWYFRTLEHVCMLTRKHGEFLAAELNLRLIDWTTFCHYSLSLREQLVQRAQNFIYWQFRNQTWFARGVLRFLPGFTRLRRADVAPTFACSRDHVLAVFRPS